MTTTLYVRGAASAPAFSVARNSAALPGLGTLNDPVPATRGMTSAKGGSASTVTLNSLAQTALQSNYLSSFVSNQPLAAQTIAAATWTIGLELREANVDANAFMAVSLYVYRPATSAIVGYIYDATTALGNEWGTSTAGRVATFSGAQVIALAGDYLVLELWSVATQGSATIRNLLMQHSEGGADVTEGSATGTASFISNPNTITFGTASTVSAAQCTATFRPNPSGANKIVEITINLKTSGGAVTPGGEAAGILVSITGANTATGTVTDLGGGIYRATYTPTATGADSIAIKFNSVAIGSSPLANTVGKYIRKGFSNAPRRRM